MSEETKNSLIESFLHLHERVTKDAPMVNNQPDPMRIKTNSYLKQYGDYANSRLSAPSSPVSSVSNSSQMNVPISQQASSAGSMFQANKTPQTAAANYDKQYKSFDTSTPQMKVGTSSSNLRVGSSGDDVSYIQRQLGIKSDSKFGDQTKQAVMDYQKKYGLKVDGIVGDQTLSHMKRQEGFAKLKSENPIGSGASSNLYTSRMNSREGGGSSAPTQTVKTISPMAGQGSSGDPNSRTRDPAVLSANISNLKRAGPMPISGNQGTFYSKATGKTALDIMANSDTTLIQNNKPIGRTGFLNRHNANNSQSPMGYITQQAGREAVHRLKQQRLNQSYEESEMTNKLIEAFMQLHSTNSSNLFVEAKKAKKLDPVGKEDEDIDNDGDKDKSDSYLHNRRKAIKAAMKEAKDPHAEGMVKAGTKAPEMTTDPDYLKKKKPEGGNSKVIQTGPNSSTVTKSTNEEVEQIDEAKKTMLHPGLGSGTIHSGVELHTAGNYAKDKTKVWVVNHKKPSDVKSVHAQNPHLSPDEAKKVSSHINNAAHPFGSWSAHGSTVVQGGLPHAMSHWTRKVANGLVNKHHTDSLKEEVEQIDEDEMYKGFMRTVHSHARSMSPKKFAKEYPSMAKHQNTIRNTPLKDVHRLKVDKDGKAFMYTKTNEEVEHIDEGVGVRNRVRKAILVGAKSAKNDKEHEINKNIITKLTGKKEAGKTYDAARKMVAKEEIEFSEAELEHIASILEGPIAPTPEEHSPKAFGSTASISGTLTDEAIAEGKGKGSGGGRPAGSKGSSKHGDGKGEGSEPKNLAAQIRFARPSGGKFTLKHPTTGETKSVDAKDATNFYTKYSGAQKPAEKEAHHDAFLTKLFGSSEKPKKAGVSLAKMPDPKS